MLLKPKSAMMSDFMSTREAWKYLDMQILKTHLKSMCVTGLDFILHHASCNTFPANKIRFNPQEMNMRAKKSPKGKVKEDDHWQHMVLFSVISMCVLQIYLKLTLDKSC